jgi:hypothetical protein
MRPALALIAITLLAVGGLLLILKIDVEGQIGGSCLRMGIAMGLAWLAEPQLRRLPRWLPFAVIGLALLLAVRPKLVPIGIFIVAALWLLRPRRRNQ